MKYCEHVSAESQFKVNTVNSKLAMADKAETGNAGEQPVRNNQSDWNVMEVGLLPASEIYHSDYLCLKKLILMLD